MKANLIASIAAAAMLSGAAYAADAPAMPDGFFFKPYIGADYEYTSINYAGVSGTAYNYGDFFSDSFNGGDIHLGARIHKNLGLEASYFDTFSSSKSAILGTSASSSTKFDGWALDAMGYLPVGQSQRFELIGTLGYARVNAKATVTVSGTPYSASGWDNAERIGGGVQYWLTDNLNVRGLVRYENVNDSAINNAILADIGVNWQF